MIQLNEKGIAKFYWPVSETELHEVREKLQVQTVKLIKKGLAENQKKWQPLRISINVVLKEFLIFYRASLLTQREFSIEGSTVNPKEYVYGKALESESDFKIAPGALSSLRKGLPRPSLLVRFLRPLRRLFREGELVRKSVTAIKRDDIIALSSDEFIQRHAKKIYQETGKRVVLCSFWEWMSLSEKDKLKLASASDEYDEQVHALLATITTALPEWTWPAGFRLHFEKIVREYLCLVGFYYERLLSEPKKIPNTLWYGSANSLWHRTLRAAVTDNGGKCVGHDHGRGVSLYPNKGEHSTVFDLCDEYVAFSPPLAEACSAIKEEITKYMFDEREKTFVGFSDFAYSAEQAARIFQPKTPMQKRQTPVALIMGGFYSGETFAGLNLLPSDYIFIDWTTRLIEKLKGQGYEVWYKCHPECLSRYPKEWETQFGIKMLQGTAEKMDLNTDVDLIAFDFMTSAVKSTLFPSEKPLLFFDFGFGVPTAKLKNILEKRISLVSGWFDKDNRAQIAWGEFENNIHTAQLRAGDKDCVKEIFGVGQC